MHVIRILFLLFTLTTSLPAAAQFGPGALPNNLGGVGNNPAPAEQAMKVPDYIKPGFQMIYLTASTSKNDDPKIGTQTGMGFTVFTVVAVLKDEVWVTAANYLTPNGMSLERDGTLDLDTDYKAQLTMVNSFAITNQDALAGDALWMPVHHLKQWESGETVEVVEGLYNYQGKQVKFISLQTENKIEESGSTEVFDANNGMKLHTGSVDGKAKRQSQMKLLETRQLDSPLIGAKWPDWAKAVKRMNYSGTYTMNVGGGGAPLVTKIGSVVKFTERGEGYAIGKQTMSSQGNDGQSSTAVQGPGTMFGSWIHPDVLANLDQGVVDDNKMMRTQTTYQVQQGNLGRLGVFVHTNEKNTFYAVNGYNLQTGALTYISMHTVASGVTVELQLEGIESE